MAISDARIGTKIGLGGVRYKEGENVLVECEHACSLEEMVDAMRTNGAEVETGVLLDDGTVLMASND